MTVPFMRAYAQLLVRTCHRRGAHAIGGMAAFIPSRRDPDVNAKAIAKVRDDKQREAGDGFDGTWVAHPDLVPVAENEFNDVLGNRANQKDRLRDDVRVATAELLDLRVQGGQITSAGVDTNVDVALRYIEAWLRGQGAVAIHNLMEDAATAEISRSQLWQWVRHRAPLADGKAVTPQAYQETRTRLLGELRATNEKGRWDAAATLLDELVLGEFQEFLTLPGYRVLDPVGH
jgi:malate synthase